MGALPALAITGGQLDTDNEYPNVGGLMVYDYRVDIPETLDFIDEVIAA